MSINYSVGLYASLRFNAMSRTNGTQESGVFDALKKKYLAALQLVIYTDPDKPEEILESYTFSFSYTQATSKDAASRSVTMNLAIDDSVATTFESSKNAAKQMMRRLIYITEDLDQLPGRSPSHSKSPHSFIFHADLLVESRIVSMRLFYTDDCPSDYEPQGFANYDGDSPYFRETELVKVLTQGCNTVRTGYHS
jgi:meiosis-specific protein